MYPSDDDDIDNAAGIPVAIRDMLTSQPAVEALGAMIWFVKRSPPWTR